jgi:hypothetical protein
MQVPELELANIPQFTFTIEKFQRVLSIECNTLWHAAKEFLELCEVVCRQQTLSDRSRKKYARMHHQ